jgi:hypothetical protein
MPRSRDSVEMPLHFCSDPEVRRFVEEEFRDIGIYRQPEFVKTAPQILKAARRQFGDYRCDDLLFWTH